MKFWEFLKSLSPGRIEELYLDFLNNFPVNFQPAVSVVVALLIIYVVYRIVKRDWIFIILLAILVPTSIPVMKSVWYGLVSIVKYLWP